MTDMLSPYELKTHYHSGRLIPFIGAGVSMSVTWMDNGEMKRGPSWRELVDQAAKEMGFENPDLLRVRGTDLQILEYFREKHSGAASLTNWLYAEMRVPDDSLRNSLIHQRLAELQNCRLFYTTNYDNFTEVSHTILWCSDLTIY